MSPADDVWLSLGVVTLCGLLLFLRIRFPEASRTSETLVLISATVVFFSVCDLFSHPRDSRHAAAAPVVQASQSLAP
jgi:hypothetical protein